VNININVHQAIPCRTQPPTANCRNFRVTSACEIVSAMV